MIMHMCLARTMMSLPVSSHLDTSKSNFLFSTRNTSTQEIFGNVNFQKLLLGKAFKPDHFITGHLKSGHIRYSDLWVIFEINQMARIGNNLDLLIFPSIQSWESKLCYFGASVSMYVYKNMVKKTCITIKLKLYKLIQKLSQIEQLRYETQG